MTRGSEWGRWDLHVHTKGTAKNDQFGDISFDEYCIQLFRKALERNIKTIGITDYFSIENYRKVKKFQAEINDQAQFNDDEKKLISKILILPNMELRISPSTGAGSLINLHLIFNPSKIEDIENQILNHIEMVHGNGNKYQLNEYGLKSLGRLYLSEDQLNDENLALKKGIEQFCIPHTELIGVFEAKNNLRSEILVFVANGDNDGVSGLKSHEEILQQQQASAFSLRNSIYQLTDGLFSAKPSDYKYFLGHGRESAEEIIAKYRSLKPCIHGSDAHRLEELFEPKMNRYCWIKAEPTFEGLKQIIHEPESRVHIGQHCPEIKNSYEVIDYIELSNNNIANEKIYFNSNLTSIIGGRSSGKSTLLQCLANTLRPNLFSEHSIERPKHLDELCRNFEIIWKDGKQDNTRQIEYFYQGHMFKKANEEGIEDIVKSLILQKNPDIYEKFKSDIDAIRHENSGSISSYFSIKNDLELHKQALQVKGKKEDIESQIAILNEQIKSYQQDDISDEDINFHQLNLEKLASIDNQLEKIKGLIARIDNIQISEIINFTNPFSIYASFPLIENDFDEFLKSIKIITEEYTATFKENSLSKLQGRYKDLKTQKNIILNDEKFKKVHNYLQNSENLKPIIVRKNNEENKLKEIQNLEEKIQTTEKKLESLFIEIRNKWLSMFECFGSLINLVNSIVISEDIKIQASNNFDKLAFYGFMQKTVNQSSDKAKSFTNKDILNEYELLEHFDTIRESIYAEEIRLKTGSSLETITKEFIDSPWFKIKYEVTYDGDNYNDMSQGKKAFVVLKMSLDCSDSKCPIIIDQPEDDLENRAIYTELVTYLKEKKKTRQIILVTHNANVVVNADSELIIIANQHGIHSPNLNNQKFQYKFGSIESLDYDPTCTSTLNQKTIKSHICEILEGGDRAFKLREQKYNLAS